MRRAIAVGALVTVALAGAAEAKQGGRVEVVDVSGIIDGPVERAILSTLEAAQDRDDTVLVVLQIDSTGVVDQRRTIRLLDAVNESRKPVVTWVGPPGARAEHGAGLLALTGHGRAVAPASSIGPIGTIDLRRTDPTALTATPTTTNNKSPAKRRMFSDDLEDAKLVQHVVPNLEELLGELDGTKVAVPKVGDVELFTDPARARVRLHSVDLLGRLLHAASQPSISYLLLLGGLVGIVFEVFHPSRGPAGLSGLVALALSLYGVTVLGGSWPAVALILAGVGGQAWDLRNTNVTIFSFAGVVALVAGSLLLFRGPWLRVDPWVLGIGIVGMTLFMYGVMTRVMRDLRLVASGELEVREAHEPHLNGGEDAP